MYAYGEIERLFFTCCLGCAMTVAAAELPEITVPAVDPPPVLDGKLDDPAWAKAAPFSPFRMLKPDAGAAGLMTALAMVDNQWLYLGFKLQANPALQHVAPKARQRDTNVQLDESVEVYFDPGTAGELYYHFKLNYKNLQGESRATRAGGRDEAWFVPWRSAALETPEGVTLEMALPLSLVAGYGDPKQARLNVLYNRVEVGLDAYGAKISEGRKTFTWSPVQRSVHDPEIFGRLRGLDAVRMQPAFLPALEQAQVVGGYAVEGAERFYTLQGMARNYSGVAGTVAVEVADYLAADVKTPAAAVTASAVVTAAVALAGMADAEFSIKVPVRQLAERQPVARMRNPVTGEIWREWVVSDTDAFRLLRDVTPDRNYYTSEESAWVRCVIGMPAAALAAVDAAVKVRDAAGRELAVLKHPPASTVLELPLADMPAGAHALKLALEQADGAEISAMDFQLIKRAPRPGCEVKIDKFNLTILNNGQPFFPFGVYFRGADSRHVELFDLVAAAGFNTVIRQPRGWMLPASDAAAYLEQARKRNLMVVEWYGGFPPETPAEIAWDEQVALSRKNFDEIQTSLRRELDVFRKHPNFLFHYNVDEPNLLNWRLRMLAAKDFCRTVNEWDGYHPVYTLFARSIPDLDSAALTGDIYGYDIYTYPGWGGWSFDLAQHMAKYTAELNDIALRQRKVVLIAPHVMALDAGRTPIAISPADQRAQSYVALIYGAKGLTYFSWLNVYAAEMWDMLAQLAGEVRELAPALLAPPVAQNIAYDPGEFDHAALKFPMAHTRLFRHPAGGYVLLAVSGSECPLRADFNIDGLPETARVQNMFGAREACPARPGGFTDTLSSYDACAYRIETAALPEPVAVTLKLTADESKREPRFSLRDKIAAVEKRKNVMPNPVFGGRTNYRQIPNYIRPVDPMLPNLGTPDSGWFLDAEQPWRGHPSLCMEWRAPFALVKPEATDGNVWYHLRADGQRNYIAIAFQGAEFEYYPPALIRPAPYVFSFYAKAAREGDQLEVCIFGWGDNNGNANQRYALGTDWRRYHLAGVMQPGGSWLPGRNLWMRVRPGAKVWISGLQLEQGATPTEFSEQ